MVRRKKRRRFFKQHNDDDLRIIVVRLFVVANDHGVSGHARLLMTDVCPPSLPFLDLKSGESDESKLMSRVNHSQLELLSPCDELFSTLSVKRCIIALSRTIPRQSKVWY